MLRFIILGSDEEVTGLKEKIKSHNAVFFDVCADKIEGVSLVEECLKYNIKNAKEKKPKYILLKNKGIKIRTDKILYVDSKSHKIAYHVIDSHGREHEYNVYGKLDEAQDKLADCGFCRVHQSYLVNMDFVSDVKRYTVYLTFGGNVPVSKARYKEVEREFKRI